MKKDKKKKRVKRVTLAPAILQPVEDGKTENTPPVDSLPFVLAAVGGKWKMRILWVLRDGTSMRYGEVKQHVSSITDMMLSQSLRELTAEELIVRQQFQQIPPKVEYRIAPPGAELIPAIELLNAWAAKYHKQV